jgi:predicted RecA/RadA family phage recombinase
MAQATLRSGSPRTADYTPGGAVTAGDVIVVGDTVVIARSDIAANALGSVDVGGGVYLVAGDDAIDAGKKVYWDDAANQVTETAGANKVFGRVAPGSSCSGAAATCDVIHETGA